MVTCSTHCSHFIALTEAGDSSPVEITSLWLNYVQLHYSLKMSLWHVIPKVWSVTYNFVEKLSRDKMFEDWDTFGLILLWIDILDMQTNLFTLWHSFCLRHCLLPGLLSPANSSCSSSHNKPWFQRWTLTLRLEIENVCVRAGRHTLREVQETKPNQTKALVRTEKVQCISKLNSTQLYL